MQVTLEVVSENGEGLGAARRRVFDEQGGKIGRAAECEWVLPNPYISRHHATVRFLGGSFYIESVGENGISVNGTATVLGPMERHPLKSGDRIFLDEYEIGVSIVGAAAQPAFDAEPLFASPPPPARPLMGNDPFEPAELDPLKQLQAGRSTSTQPRNAGPDMQWTHTSGLADHFTPPAPQSPAGVEAIPADWDKTKWNLPATPAAPAASPIPAAAPPPATPQWPLRPAPARAAAAAPAATARPPQPAPAAVPPAPAGGGGALDIDSLLRGAGVDPQSVPPETATVLGQILRLVVEGTIDVLRARSEIKSEFRLPVTRLKVSENNPLKFSVNADDAMASLLSRRNTAYLQPVEAFQDAFEDIRHHQVAMLAGMRAGFDAMLDRLDAATLQEQFDKQIKRGGLLSMSSKSRYWDLFEEYCRELGADKDSSFRRLFGEEFATAYESQLDKLKRGRDRKR
ncbi:MAG TPA: type VI secretion system-associated FHA domain protein TagH [Steroidobacteraceae bacterium]|nr:type VI secretion system-associated FHA domain protein TagH [Steroidobacteraceae bacterium]